MKILIIFLLTAFSMNSYPKSDKELYKLASKVIKEKKANCSKGFTPETWVNNRTGETAYYCMKNKIQDGIEVWATKDGVVHSLYYYKNNKKNGVGISWYRNGQIFRKLNNLKGKEHGKTYEYDKSGKLIKESTYISGIMSISPKFDKLLREGIITKNPERYKFDKKLIKEFSKNMSKSSLSANQFRGCLGFVVETGIEYNLKAYGKYPSFDWFSYSRNKFGYLCAITNWTSSSLKKRCLAKGGRIAKRTANRQDFCTGTAQTIDKVIKPEKSNKNWWKILVNMYDTNRAEELNNVYFYLFTSMNCGKINQYKKIFNKHTKNVLYRWKYTDLDRECGGCIQCRKGSAKRLGMKNAFTLDFFHED